ncbi:hypothetical protein SmJEL517_g04366 [Synchytrium microbalum]|uniref:Rab-GAP TBC domain-containing protein n=1 Tax=Synchytrium microbalum TaxID=1806994 RepID=A0A507BUA1_9FUNG|nr:uncharacterized protein SmJEL517_g04366 [Synchytrium microbalum]TPX32527.1 hypothetical protein SmJEL517_g04366 [Synchytrium microbalum]
MKYSIKIARFELLVSKDVPATETFESFRLLCLFGGAPDEAGIRPRCWKLLLNYLPFEDRASWDQILKTKRTVYYDFVRELAANNSHEEPAKDHPLKTGGKWQAWFDEGKVLDQIDKDVRRTLPDMGFFQRQVPPSIYSPLTCGPTQQPDEGAYEGIPNRRNLFKRLASTRDDVEFGARTRKNVTNMNGDVEESDEPEYDLHWEAIERLLFIFARLNSGIGYIQGMNELLGPIYFVLASDSDLAMSSHAEADSFYLFSTLMEEFRDHYNRSLDNIKPTPSRSSSATPSTTSASSRKTVAATESVDSSSIPGNNGIGASMERLMKKLEEVDSELYDNLQDKSIHAAFFGFRWLAVLLTQEFELPDVIRLWDSLFADIALDIRAQQPHNGLKRKKFEFLITFCCSMLICIRDQLLQSEFPQTVKLLQSYPIRDVEVVLRQAYALTPNSMPPGSPEAPMSPVSDATSVDVDPLRLSRTPSPIRRFSEQIGNFFVTSWNSSVNGSVGAMPVQSSGPDNGIVNINGSSTSPPKAHEEPIVSVANPSPKRSWASLLARPDNIKSKPSTAASSSVKVDAGHAEQSNGTTEEIKSSTTSTTPDSATSEQRALSSPRIQSIASWFPRMSISGTSPTKTADKPRSLVEIVKTTEDVVLFDSDN